MIAHRKDIEVLVNNAGFGNKAAFSKDQFNQIEMIQVHNLAPVALCHAVIPQMKNLGRGTIINVASLPGFIPNPDDALYSSTKAFLINFSESLFMELRPFGIKVQALCPGFTHTDIHARMGLTKDDLKLNVPVTWMTAGAVVDISLKKLRGSRPICIPGFWNRVLYQIVRRIPKRLIYRIFGKGRAIKRK